MNRLPATIEAAIDVEETAGTITEPMCLVRVQEVAKKQLAEASTAQYYLIRDVPDDSESAQVWFKGWDLLERLLALHVEEKVRERVREHVVARLLALSPGLPAGILDEWYDAGIRSVTGDARGSVTRARTMMETVCKHILDERNLSYDAKDDLPDLVRKLRSVIEIHYASSPEIGDAARQLMHGLTSTAYALSLLRNRKSDAHGHGPYDIQANEREARASVLAAAAFAELAWAAHVGTGSGASRLDEREVREVEAVLAAPPYSHWPVDRGRVAAEQWVALGFSTQDVREWIPTECGSPEMAKLLRDQGFTPKTAALRSRQDDMRTIAELVKLGDLDLFGAQVLRDQILNSGPEPGTS